MLNRYYLRCKKYFKDLNGGDFTLTPGQQEIFRVIYDPQVTRAVIKTITQYGKSEVASMALDLMAVERKEKVLIVAPSAKQASIIMGKVIEHLFDNQALTGMITYAPQTLERLKEEKSKERITFKNGSEIKMLTAEAKYVSQESKNLMGFGATTVLVDESSLIPDPMFAKILRMVGGVENGKLVQLGNPFENNHFGRAFDSPRYEKITINYHQALTEGRVTQDFLDEAKETISALDWQIFYECKFPDTGAEDALIPRLWIEMAVNQRGCELGKKQTGLDVARFGRDKTVYAFRNGGLVSPFQQTEKMDLMEVIGWTRPLLEKDKPEVHCTDVVGVGAGVHDRLVELQDNGEEDLADIELQPINVGEAPTDERSKKRFANLRAQIYWGLREWFKPDSNGRSMISIPDDPELKRQLEEIKYKYGSEKKIKIEAKDEMKKRLGVSPDKADALALAFWDNSFTEPEIVIIET